MVVTNDETLHQRCVHFKGQGLAKPRQYWHDVIGYNYRMTNIQAAIGLAQLEQVEFFLQKKRAVAEQYLKGFANTPFVFHKGIGDVSHSYWMCSILMPDAEMRDPMREHLEKAGIETRPLFYPVHTMPMYAEKYHRHIVAEGLGWRGINLPSHPGLTFEEVEYIVQTVQSFL